MQPSLRALPGGNATKAFSSVMLMLTYFQVKESFMEIAWLPSLQPYSFFHRLISSKKVRMNHLVISSAPVQATRSETWSPALASKAPQATGRPLGSNLDYIKSYTTLI